MSLCAAEQEERPLLNEGDDVKHEHMKSGVTNERVERVRSVLQVLWALGSIVLCTGLATTLHLLSIETSSSVRSGSTNHTDSEQETNRDRTFRPHIVYIILDDMGSYDLGMHGTGIQTPTCDELAQSGVYLSNYYVLPTCSPTRCAILSGRYPIRTGVNEVIEAKSTVGLPLDEETLPQVLSKVGYQRHAVGKWHAGHSCWEQTPTFRGFQSFLGFYLGSQQYFSHVYHLGMYDLRFDREEFCGHNCSKIVDERDHYSTHLFTREAIRVINETDEGRGPLFLWLAFQAVHGPTQVPPEYEARYEDNKSFTQLRKTYAGMLTAADEGILNVTKALQAKGLWDDTLLVVTTDNGGPTQKCCAQGSSNRPLRGGKGNLWEGGTSGDGFLAGPALKKLGISGGRRIPHLFHVVDWLPTLASMTGALPAGNPLDGVNQLESLRGGGPSREEIFVGLGNEKQGPAIRHKEWKLIQASFSLDERGKKKFENKTEYLLFNLQKDRKERRSVAEEYPEKVKELISKMEIYKAASGFYQQEDDPSCPFTGKVKTEMGPTFMPWCRHSNRVLFYT